MSAGILLFRRRAEELEVLIVHPGGPFWRNRDSGAWSIPKGEHAESEDPLEAARREFSEELGLPLPKGEPLSLGEVTQKGGKRVSAWALEGDLDPSSIRSNSFEMEWPPRSGRRQSFPEVDRAEWFPPSKAVEKLIPAQREFVERLLARVAR